MFYIWYYSDFFCLQMWKGLADSEKAKRLSKEEIKKQLLDLIITEEVLEFEDLNKEAEEILGFEKAAEIIKWYEDIIKTKKKGIINVAYHEGQVLKRFKEKKKFVTLATIIFKINVFKLCKKYPKLFKTSIGLGFFKNFHKDIKAIRKVT